MLKNKILLIFITFCNLISIQILEAQTGKHPIIWVTEDEREDILDKIEKYDWAKDVLEQLHTRIDETKILHTLRPQILMNTIPTFGGHMTKHNAILTLAAESGMLYFLTKDRSYAQLAVDVVSAYAKILAQKTPETTEIMGSDFHDPRTTYTLLALAYDFTYDYLNSPTTKSFNNAIGIHEDINKEEIQKAFRNVVGSILQEYGKPDTHGSIISNHPILTAPGALYSILCIEDDTERERLFNVFWEKGTKHQPSFKNTILPMYSKQGVWPESLSYSFMPDVPLVLNIIDRIKPEMDVTNKYQHILEGNLLFDNLRMPDGRFVRFGDSKRNNDTTNENYSYALQIAERRGYDALKEKMQIALHQNYAAKDGRKSVLVDNVHNNNSYLQLFWGLPLPKAKVEKIDYKPTVIVEHAGIALQRNYVEKKNEMYGLCGIIGGASYVHSHLTGISMELYGAGYVMAPNAGLPKSVAERRIPLHENYYRLYAGNNTVVVNGTSHGLQPGSWKDRAYVWQNTTVNIASEPKHLEDPVSKNFSFATQFLKDEVNKADQERTLSTIRTSEKTGYYFDMFRSKSLENNKFHDYIYHNIGDDVLLKDSKGAVLEVHPTDQYKNDFGDPVQAPGWRYFENTSTTMPTKNAVAISFPVTFDDRYMHMFVPNGVERTYTTALAPATREAKNGYEEKKTQVVAIRQKGEAWDRPFVAVYEPTIGTKTSVQNIEPLMDGDKVVGAKVTSNVKNVVIIDYIISQDKSEAVYSNEALGLKFEGRFCIVRIEKQKKKATHSLYIGDGEQLSFGSYSLEGGQLHKGFKVFED